MNIEIWQQLRLLETRDATIELYNSIHARDLNARRAIEINSATKQSREYFDNASRSDYSVRPLLVFYGITSLSRAVALLLNRDGGEECLTPGHGLMTVEWGSLLSGDVATGLSRIGELKIKSSRGIFYEFLRNTRNRMSIHVNSSNVDWNICYGIPEVGYEISLLDINDNGQAINRDHLTAVF